MKAMTVALAGMTLWAGLGTAADLPKGWFPAGSNPKDYEMKLDTNTTHSGKGSLSLKSTAPTISGFGTVMQNFKADDYRGKRVCMYGFVRSVDVAAWAGLWLRVDGPDHKVLSFDNMADRAIRGTTDWKRYEIVLDVPESAQLIAFGILLNGTGQVWLDDIKFETAGKDVSTTGSRMGATAPTNLDFEE